jgi:ketosteroid isomerase-like protein
MTLADHVREFIRLFEAGRGPEALERFYAQDVIVFENRELSRAGRERCIALERESLARLQGPPSMKALRFAVDEAQGTAFIEWLIRVTLKSGEVHRLEEVLVQLWEGDAVVSERHYYEGYIDEGYIDEGHIDESSLDRQKIERGEVERSSTFGSEPEEAP